MWYLIAHAHRARSHPVDGAIFTSGSDEALVYSVELVHTVAVEYVATLSYLTTTSVPKGPGEFSVKGEFGF